MSLRWVAACLAALVVWVHLPALQAGGLLGAPGTDVLRAAWGLDLGWQALPAPPFWTDHVGFPVGVKLVTLPFFSGILGAPLRAILGPVLGYNAWMLTLLWASGLATAWLVRELTQSGAAGLLAGAVMVVQPMIFVALTDGTPEFVALWSVPAALAAVHKGRHDPRWALAGGVLLGVVALDSPYHAVFTIPFVPIVAWGIDRRSIAAAAAGAAVVGGVLVAMYWGLPLTASEENVEGNAVSLRVWEQWESGELARGWDYTLGAGFIPVYLLGAGALLALLRPVRALPWLLVACACLAWSFSSVPANESYAWQNYGGAASAVMRGVTWFNEHLTPPVVRFPRRWLVPAALGLSVAAGYGLTRIPWEWVRGVAAAGLGLTAAFLCLRLTGYRDHLPHFSPPDPAFAEFVRDDDNDGAVLFVPRVRGAKQATARDALPVFAELSRDIASADLLWLQVACERASVYAPYGLRTIAPRYGYGQELSKFLHDLDDLATPQTVGTPIPGSATMEPERRARAATHLRDEGLGFVVIDEKTLGEEGLALAQLPFAAITKEVRHFDDGTGVTVIVLTPPGAAPTSP